MVQLVRIAKDKFYNVALAKTLEVEDIGNGTSRVFIRPTEGIDVVIHKGETEKVYAVLDSMHARASSGVLDSTYIALLVTEFQKLEPSA